MPAVVVPFRGSDPKRRLAAGDAAARVALATAMLEDVVEAAAGVGPVFVVSPSPLPSAAAGVTHVVDPRHGQGAAVRAGLDAAVAAGHPGPYLLVNADLPCATSRDLLALAGAVPPGGLALVPAADGTTNALALSDAAGFEPAYGPGSAARFAAAAPSRAVEAPNLVDDVDTLDDLLRLRDRLGMRTLRVLGALDLRPAA
jgi:2-phospho-L-lactate/phosphoenolpyruvate guanylyltransferase